jgi:hypothetical protein
MNAIGSALADDLTLRRQDLKERMYVLIHVCMYLYMYVYGDDSS